MWIRPGSDVVYRSRRRAVSAPADDYRVSRHDIESAPGTSRARAIASYATDDSNTIAALSKRNDRDFLHGVAAKMASISAPGVYSQSAPPPPVHRRPPPPPPSNSHYLRRAAALTPEDNIDIESYLQRPTGGYRRAASLPPPSLTVGRASVPKWYPSSAAYYGRPGARAGGRSSWAPAPGYYGGLPPRYPTGERIDALNDAVVGVAHTSLYGDIVIGIPYKKRYMYSVQRDLDDLDTQSTPAGRVVTRVSSLPPSSHFARTRPGSIAVPNGYTVPSLAKPYSRASYASPGAYTRPLPAIYRAPLGAIDDDVISIKSYPGAGARGRSVTTSGSRYPLTTHYDDFENDVDLAGFDQFSALKRDAKSMLNRYSLPPAAPSNGPKHFTASELDHKYGQILSNMQAQQRVPSRSEHNYSTSAKPGDARRATRPMSETRKKLRDLLCKSRNDPHYFDD